MATPSVDTRLRSVTSFAEPKTITIKVNGIDVEVAPYEESSRAKTIRLLNGREFLACRDDAYYFAHQFHLEEGVLVQSIFSTAKPSSSLIVDEEDESDRKSLSEVSPRANESLITEPGSSPRNSESEIMTYAQVKECFAKMAQERPPESPTSFEKAQRWLAQETGENSPLE